jgi:hypothetical protein
MADETRDMTYAPIAPPIVQARPVGHSLGPLVVWHRLEAPVVGRLYALAFALLGLALLTVAVWMTPSHDHMGTHRQLGLPPCGFVAVTGFPCPTCGMTTAYAFVVRGRLFEAAKSSVFGLLLAVATIAAIMAALTCAVIGRYPNLNWYRVNAVKLVYYGALVLVLSWALKIAIGLHDGSLPVR